MNFWKQHHLWLADITFPEEKKTGGLEDRALQETGVLRGESEAARI